MQPFLASFARVPTAASGMLRRGAIGWAIAVAVPLLFPGIVPEPFRIAVLLAAGTLSLMMGVALLWRDHAVAWAVLAFVVAVLASVGRVPLQRLAVSHFSSLSIGVFFMAIVATWVTTQRRLAVVTAVVLVAGFAILAVALPASLLARPKFMPLYVTAWLPEIMLPLSGVESDGLRGRVNANALAGAALLIAPLAISTGLSTRGVGLVRALVLIARFTAVMAIVVILASQSRSGWIAAWLTAMVASLFARGRGRVVVIAVLMAVAATILAFARPDEGTSSVTTIGESLRQRAEIWSYGFELLGADPFGGIGLNQFRHVHHARTPAGGPDIAHAHNIFLQTALDLGTIGLVCYLSLLAVLAKAFFVARRGPPLPRLVSSGAALSIVAVHFFGLADAIALGAKVGIFQWLAAGTILSAAQLSRDPEVNVAPSNQ